MSSGTQTVSPSPSGPWAYFARARSVIPAILLLALALRLGLILGFPISPRTDSLWYLERGREIAAGMGYQEGGFPTAFWPVGYPALIGVATWLFGPTLFGPLLFNLIAQAATILLILWLARRLGAGEGAARLAGLLYALYPAHIAYTGDTAAETTATAVTLAGIALILKGRGGKGLIWALVGALVLGAAMLMRPQTMLLPPFLVGALWVSRGVDWRRALLLMLLIAAGMAVVVAPWTMRNRAVLGAPVLVSTNGGVALQAGANDLADGGYFQVEKSPLWAQVGIPFADRVQRQVEIDRRLKVMATDWIAAHPVRWGLLGVRKVALLWLKDGDGCWSLDASHPERAGLWKIAQGVNQLFYMALLVLAAIGIGRAARAAWAGRQGAAMLVAGVMPLFCTALAFGFTGQTRYHYPAMPFVVILAAWVIARRLGEPSRAPAAMSGHDG
ncbi:ArnT family glycosyltransferase [Sphingomonas sanguinis]|uniref:Glycosyltransferase family 39 protein n=1 Tax=Sphingomonas sanguinis TaxID=33051 RepID=A0A7Y7URV8_9SPHN|nr:glycosyltransferase family 39 protein [Sphingomonas sanguinis]MBZ6383421.1 glycosyltransferase family 39 protein [Sphingomonas sanguinis]NNG48735.1 hypothetical protein [Sphingomonas sanguinis]NNG51980.1 hypothetical protein [Sphingomonas sanguinis]NVP32717.1 glycosyltransferase family 39 protein [Sphingomonas sanguinis]